MKEKLTEFAKLLDVMCEKIRESSKECTSLGFQKFKTGTKDLYHNSWDVLNITLYVPGTIPGASHMFAHLILPTSCEDGRWCPIHGPRAGHSPVDLAS